MSGACSLYLAICVLFIWLSRPLPNTYDNDGQYTVTQDPIIVTIASTQRKAIVVHRDVSKLETSQTRCGVTMMQNEENAENALGTFAETFEGKQFRAQIHDDVLHYCIVDIMAIVSDSPQPRVYWAKRKKSLMDDEGLDEEFKKSITKLKLVSPADSKLYPMDCCPRPTLLRILMTVPSPKAEPFRKWLSALAEETIHLAETGQDRIEQMRQRYRKRGRDDQWIEVRLENDAARNQLQIRYKDAGIQDRLDYAALNGNLHRVTFGITVSAHKRLKSVDENANLQDHSTRLENAIETVSLITADMLGEQRNSSSFNEFHRDTTDAGNVGHAALKAAEKALGEPVVSSQNFLAEEAAAKRVQKGTRKNQLLPPKHTKAAQQEEASSTQQQPGLFDI